jgi:hypothetical protein
MTATATLSGLIGSSFTWTVSARRSSHVTEPHALQAFVPTVAGAKRLAASTFVDLFQENETSALRSGSIELAAGNYQLDLKLYNLPSGNYQLNLQASYQLSVLDFMV